MSETVEKVPSFEEILDFQEKQIKLRTKQRTLARLDKDIMVANARKFEAMAFIGELQGKQEEQGKHEDKPETNPVTNHK